jgi:hypothetical protein
MSDNHRPAFKMLVEAYDVVLAAWKAATDPIRKATLEAKKDALGMRIVNFKWD